MILNGMHITIIVLAAVASVAVVAFLYRKDTEQEARLKGYSEIASWLKEIKFPKMSTIFRDLSVKDFSGTAKGILQLVELVKDPAHRDVLLDEHFWDQFAKRLKSEIDWPKIQQAVADRVAATAASEKAKAV